MITVISETDTLANVQDVLVAQVIHEGFITKESFVIDATHFEVRDKPKAAIKKKKPVPKKWNESSRTSRSNGKQQSKN